MASCVYVASVVSACDHASLPAMSLTFTDSDTMSVPGHATLAKTASAYLSKPSLLAPSTP